MNINNQLFCFFDSSDNNVYAKYYGIEKQNVNIKFYNEKSLIYDELITTNDCAQLLFTIKEKIDIKNIKILYNDSFESELLKYLSFKRGGSNLGLIKVCEIANKTKIMVEIGSYQGESTAIFSTYLPNAKIYAVDPWQNHYDAKDGSSEDYDMKDVEYNFDIITKNRNIIKKKMTSEEFSFMIDDESVDLVYIDGNHQYDFVKNDILKWIPKIKQNGYISGHDYHMFEDVRNAVDEILGVPDIIVEDNWLKRKTYSEEMKSFLNNKMVL